MAKLKQPRTPVTVGAKVRRRGGEIGGVVDKVAGTWVNVLWEGGKSRQTPRICYIHELEVLQD